MSVRDNCVPTAKDWRHLTIFGQKRAYFTTESYFRESWHDLWTTLREETIGTLARIGVVVLKPDAMAARKGAAALDCLEAAGFVPLLGYPIRYDRLAIREIWRYQFSEATIDRLEVIDYLYGLGEGLMLFLLDVTPSLRMPASARLHMLKGAAEKRLRDGNSLRCKLDTPNGVIRYLHIPDEPADIVRELGIMFERNKRMEIYERLKTRSHHGEARIRQAIRELEVKQLPFKFDIEDSWMRVMKLAQSTHEGLRARIFALHDLYLRGEHSGWEDIFQVLREIDVSMLDILNIAAVMIQQDIEYEYHLIDGDALRGWDERLFQEMTQPEAARPPHRLVKERTETI